jgi:hypothetical protein
MDRFKKLIPNKNLKTGLWKKLASSGRSPFVQYDVHTDYIMCSLIPFDIETTVHYIDKYFAFLYNEDNEIVGFQIENFIKGFLPKHAELEKVWKLSEVTNAEDRVSNFGELTIKVQKIMPRFIKEVMGTSSSPTVRELKQAFAS